MNKEQKMEIYDNILCELCEQHDCAWWDVIDGDLCDELDAKVKALGLDDDDYGEWMGQNIADL